MKIAITGIRGIPARYGGFETCAEETAVRFARNHKVITYCRKHNGSNTQSEYRGVRLIVKSSINLKQFDTLSHTFLSTMDIISNTEIEIVHLYNVANSIFIPLMKLFGKKVVVSVDGLEWKRLKWGPLARAFYRVSEYIGAKTADILIADSKVVKKYYEDKFNIVPEFIPYGAQIDDDIDSTVLDKFGIKPREYLLFVGRLVPEKGVHNLIAAYNRVKPKLPLVIVGGDNNQREYIESLKAMASESIKFPGFVYGRQYQALNKFPYAYVTASLIEGTSPALVSAMSAGNCVLVSGIEENRETCGEAGIYFKENDIDDLAEKIKLIIEKSDLVVKQRRKAYEHAAANYDWDAVAEKYLKLFGELLKIENQTAGEEELAKPEEYHEQISR